MKFRDSLPKYDLYRGSMRLLVNGSGVECVNNVDMDDYLKGVVPAEMPPLWPIEAVKAQVVASRSYAYVRFRPTIGPTTSCRLPTTRSTAASGSSIRAPTRRSVLTADKVVMYDGPGREHLLLHRRWRLHGEQRVRLGRQQRLKVCPPPRSRICERA